MNLAYFDWMSINGFWASWPKPTQLEKPRITNASNHSCHAYGEQSHKHGWPTCDGCENDNQNDCFDDWSAHDVPRWMLIDYISLTGAD